MCEIAVVDPSRLTDAQMFDITQTFAEEQGDGVGILAVLDDGEKYEYRTYKSATPHWTSFNEFINRYKDEAWRYVIHGRFGTRGDPNRQNTHPLDTTECDDTDIEYVVHNGSVRGYVNKRRSMEKDGVTFSTDVDSEMIAHKVTEIPDDAEVLDGARNEDDYRLRGNLNYLLFTEDAIMVYNSGKYRLTENLKMTCRRNDIKFQDDSSYDINWLVARPGEQIETFEEGEAPTYNTTRSRGTSSLGDWYDSRRNSVSRGSTSTTSTSTTSDSSWTGEDKGLYPTANLIPESDTHSAIKVGPDTVYVTDEQNETTKYVNREEDPSTYYFYCIEEGWYDGYYAEDYEEFDPGAVPERDRTGAEGQFHIDMDEIDNEFNTDGESTESDQHGEESREATAGGD